MAGEGSDEIVFQKVRNCAQGKFGTAVGMRSAADRVRVVAIAAMVVMAGENKIRCAVCLTNGLVVT